MLKEMAKKLWKILPAVVLYFPIHEKKQKNPFFACKKRE